MTPDLLSNLPTAAGTSLAAVAAGYAVIAAGAAACPGRRRPRPAAAAEPVSVLKPLCGAEPGLYENLRSFCEQSHPRFEILFGLRDANDPAAAVVRRLQAEYPRQRIRLVVDSRTYGSNLKVSTLINLSEHAAHSWLVLADSDIRVAPDYLGRVTAPLADPGVGIVTCLYRGLGRSGGWSRFSAGFIGEWFAPSVRLAHFFGGTRFGFGATIALRRETLESIGGFGPLRDVLADDFWLGELTRLRGHRTVLSDVVVTTDVTEPDLRSVWHHEVRWMRTIRTIVPAAFPLICISFPFPLLLIGLALARTPSCLAVALIGGAARLALPAAAERGPERWRAFRRAWLSPLRDTLLLMEWAAAFTGSSVRWRGRAFRIVPASGIPGPR